ncbi:MAG: hypothetical protein GF388_04715 [Candidatus Aegiribacteria sp.]|nr:hypothetical protein [Candidatus Aegiribacteria sp.]MBD3294529.1 hypothetical protein [Candidatus Fermentibacteria bacterium]
MDTEEFREILKNRTVEAVADTHWVLAVWEGGSAATGNLDRYSDLDLYVVVEDDYVEEFFRLFQDLLERNYGITHTLRIPEPAWHGHSQCFYFLRNCPEFFYVDLLVQKLSSGNRFLETDRHGVPEVWLDRRNIVSPGSTPLETVEERIRDYLSRQDVILLLAATEIRKQLARGAMVDAASQFNRFISARLAGLLNIRYRPARLDFGLRYADRAYPEEAVSRLKELLTYSDMKNIEDRLEKALLWARELLEELRERHLTG